MKYLPICLLFLSACATVTTPTGGPKDELPPKLISSTPSNNQVRFDGKNIELTFSEYVKLNNPKEEIIIIPSSGKKTEIVAKNNRVLIKPELDWKENTTYTINFREAVQDITESNEALDLKLAFSTGNYLDSLKIEGTVTQALSELPPDKITVAVFRSDTFNIFDHTPEYFTKANKEGNFSITNLQPGTYRIYAFEDKNKNLKVESKNEKFAFKAEPIVLNKDIKDVTLRLVNIDSRPLRLNSVRTQSDINTIRFNKYLESFTIKSDVKVLTTYGADQTEVIAYYPSTNTDSVSVKLSATDSIQQKIDTLVYIKRDKNERIEEQFRVSYAEPKLNQETKAFTFSATYNKPLLAINLDSISVRLDSTNLVSFTHSTVRIDTINKKIFLTHSIEITDPKKQPNLQLGKGFLISIDQDSTKAEAKTIEVATTETTAILQVEVQTKETHFITQILDLNNLLIDSRLNEKKSTFKYINPENVRIRVIVDTNKNGKWDTANYLTNTEAEQTIYYQTEEKKFETPLRANWEVGPLIIKF